MFKWVSWVIRMGATALLLSFLCIWTTGYIVNSYMESVIKQLDLPLDIQPIALSGVWGTLWGADKTPKKEEQAEASKPPIEQHTPDPSQSQSNGVQNSESPSNEISEEGGQDIHPDDDQAVAPEVDASPSPGPEPDSNGGEEGTVPAFNGEAAIGQLTDSERRELYAMVVSKLSQEQLKQLSDSLQGGLSPEELTAVEGMLKASLSEQEYSQMMELLQGTENPEKGASQSE
ncbi:hypothetical protein [Cohnella cholangitidis]|uniref:Uncharacterized protein n=1 Tax=Cohnella cholangitidis TaxID=2598458 RepID=A0A7G5BYW2_9BACL|nr:hypothetical protein [Cohnella cholangitidis]QMV42146.1 hypothetical protein FPL14_13785 [Cohnella cholangitidis]